MKPVFALARPLALSTVAGVVLVGSFPPLDLWPLALLAPAPLCWIVSNPDLPRRTAVLSGFCFGLGFFSGVTYWVVPVMKHFGGLPWVVAVALLLLLVAVLSLFITFFAGATHGLARILGTGAALALAPALWVTVELARNHVLTGFPWARLGTSVHAVPGLLQLASVTGVYGLSFLLLATAAGMAWVGHHPRRGSAWGLLGVAVLGLAATQVWGQGRIGRLESAMASGGQSLRVACVQGNVPQDRKWSPEEAQSVVDRQVELTELAVARGARLVVWPESSLPVPLRSNGALLRRLTEVTEAVDVSLIIGSLDWRLQEAGHVYNSAFLVHSNGPPILAYDKVHLVPFGEYIPMRRLLFFASKLVEQVGQLTPGSGEQHLTTAGLPEGIPRLGILICYEILFPRQTRDAVGAGAEVLLNLTNDAWFGATSAPYQHFSEAVLRAVESGRWVVRAANTGISGVIAPTGRVVSRTELGVATLAEAEIVIANRDTFYAGVGDVFAGACVIISLSAVLLAWSGLASTFRFLPRRAVADRKPNPPR